MIIYGHRGSKGTLIENSLSGFIRNLNSGTDHFELDIQLTADNQLAVFHDTNLKRLTGINRNLNNCSMQELSKINLIGTNDGIPSLHDIIENCQSAKHWQFEIKTHTANLHFIPAMQAIISKFQLTDKIVITSKHMGILKAFKKQLPTIKIGLVQEWPIPFSLYMAKKINCEYLCINKTLASQKYIDSAHKLGLHVSVWTVNDIDTMKRMQQYGADSVISDYPQVCQYFYNNFPVTHE